MGNEMALEIFGAESSTNSSLAKGRTSQSVILRAKAEEARKLKEFLESRQLKSRSLAGPSGTVTYKVTSSGVPLNELVGQFSSARFVTGTGSLSPLAFTRRYGTIRTSKQIEERSQRFTKESEPTAAEQSVGASLLPEIRKQPPAQARQSITQRFTNSQRLREAGSRVADGSFLTSTEEPPKTLVQSQIDGDSETALLIGVEDEGRRASFQYETTTPRGPTPREEAVGASLIYPQRELPPQSQATEYDVSRGELFGMTESEKGRLRSEVLFLGPAETSAEFAVDLITGNAQRQEQILVERIQRNKQSGEFGDVLQSTLFLGGTAYLGGAAFGAAERVLPRAVSLLPGALQQPAITGAAYVRAGVLVAGTVETGRRGIQVGQAFAENNTEKGVGIIGLTGLEFLGFAKGAADVFPKPKEGIIPEVAKVAEQPAAAKPSTMTNTGLVLGIKEPGKNPLSLATTSTLENTPLGKATTENKILIFENKKGKLTFVGQSVTTNPLGTRFLSEFSGKAKIVKGDLGKTIKLDVTDIRFGEGTDQLTVFAQYGKRGAVRIPILENTKSVFNLRSLGGGLNAILGKTTTRTFTPKGEFDLVSPGLLRESGVAKGSIGDTQLTLQLFAGKRARLTRSDIDTFLGGFARGSRGQSVIPRAGRGQSQAGVDLLDQGTIAASIGKLLGESKTARLPKTARPRLPGAGVLSGSSRKGEAFLSTVGFSRSGKGKISSRQAPPATVRLSKSRSISLQGRGVSSRERQSTGIQIRLNTQVLGTGQRSLRKPSTKQSGGEKVTTRLDVFSVGRQDSETASLLGSKSAVRVKERTADQFTSPPALRSTFGFKGPERLFPFRKTIVGPVSLGNFGGGRRRVRIPKVAIRSTKKDIIPRAGPLQAFATQVERGFFTQPKKTKKRKKQFVRQRRRYGAFDPGFGTEEIQSGRFKPGPLKLKL